MKTFYTKGLHLWFDRHEAKELYRLLEEDTTLSKSLRKKLKQKFWELLKPLYLYEVKCHDCQCKLKRVTDKKLTQKQIEQDCAATGGGLGILCGSCLEDYK